MRSQGIGGALTQQTSFRRIGFVAAEIVQHGGVAICAAVSPYRATRNDVRNLIGAEHFVYDKARRGEIKDLTGIDDPYEPPEQPEVTLDTVTHTPEENARLILYYLCQHGFVRMPAGMLQNGMKVPGQGA